MRSPPPGLKAALSLTERRALRTEYVPRFRSALAELMAPEIEALRDVIANDPGVLAAWTEEFYPEHAAAMVEALTPLVLDYGARVVSRANDEIGSTAGVPTEQFADRYTDTMVGRWTGSSIAQVMQLIRDEPEELAGMMGERLDKWADTRHVWTGEKEATQAGGAFAKLTYISGGVERMVWRATGSSCPLCRRLDGKTVAITEPFVRQGETVEPTEDAEDRAPLEITSTIGHPPLHGLGGSGGVCDCLVAAA